MRYIKVNWKHNDQHDPKIIYSELDQALWERRKVEVFPDGSYGFAIEGKQTKDTMLGEEPWPDLKKIAEDPQFELSDISKDDFEKIFSLAQEQTGKSNLIKKSYGAFKR